MNLPNRLTIARILLVPLLIIIYMFPYSYFGIEVASLHLLDTNISIVDLIVLLIFIVASLTDYFDGQIARSKGMITTFGKFVDPIADKLLVNTTFLLLAGSNTISILIPIIMISRDTVVDAIKMSAASKQVVVAASKLGKLKTVTQMIAIIMLLLNNFPFNLLNINMANLFAWIATVVSIISGIDYFMKNRSILMETM
ncbi:CDP-diacylglycerol--glycerol-3-phosphate 3-phosphatidyltransferase [Thomasclavelia sp.]|uniref:CDP-diacylglycerol--glycerol-3-phosphate 3-phosphatidyltransferase n=1 Tax=Thomasclavelia sp. TaxID=3025757 RepID=UPI0025EACD36|nr:CDP-diacylglycerol--glycerol-3-phosphate 3-phosphatidyltransferase [Thomasclavelia sp.]